MKSAILFQESQKFKQWWLWLLLLGINVQLLFGTYQQIVLGKQFGDNPISNTTLVTITSLIILLSLLFAVLRLDTVIQHDGIYVRFFPVHLKFKQYPWVGLHKAFVREYSPLLEYGGWGIRFGLFGKGTAFNVSGNKGLQLEFTNGKKLLIGTKNLKNLLLH